MASGSMPLEPLDHLSSSDPEGAVTVAQMPFILPGVGRALADQVAGAEAHHDPGDGLCDRMKKLQAFLISIRRKLCRGTGREHRSNFSQCQGAGYVEEVTQGRVKIRSEKWPRVL
jgi:hypothetical protein